MKPMLAAPTDGTNLRYPLLVSPKLDGIRALVIDGVVVSRSLKPIPNKHVQKLFGHFDLNGIDGELIVGSATAPDVFQRTTSGVMSIDGEPDVWFHAFDYRDPVYPFEDRFTDVIDIMSPVARGLVVPHTTILDEHALLEHEQLALAAGYEGVMIRDPRGLYKHGRSTLKQGWLLKLKRFEDSEAVVTGVTELLHNSNEATTNKLGYKERSSKKAGKVGMGMLGALQVKDLKTGVTFDIGTGFTQAQRKALWCDQKRLLGQVAKYKYQPTGVKEKPRFPVFLGFRDRRDL